MHVGATLRLLRVASGMGLRDLARRLGVSGAYLSRVEKGVDPAPTFSRLEAMARELALPPALLIDLANQVAPVVTEYVQRVPEAAALFLQIAHRELEPAQLAKIRAFVETEFPGPPNDDEGAHAPRLAQLLTPERVILGLSCGGIEDVLDVAVERLRFAIPAEARPALAQTLGRRDHEAGGFIGGGVAVPNALVEGASAAACLITLSPPLACATPDGLPVRLVLLLVAPPHDKAHLLTLAHVARLAAAGFADRIANITRPEQALQLIATLEAWR